MLSCLLRLVAPRLACREQQQVAQLPRQPVVLGCPAPDGTGCWLTLGRARQAGRGCSHAPFGACELGRRGPTPARSPSFPWGLPFQPLSCFQTLGLLVDSRKTGYSPAM